MNRMNLKDKIRVIEDFPRPGISFKDISTLLNDSEALQEAIDQMCAAVPEGTNVIVGPEARGFIFGSAMAYNLEARFVLARKPGKLPFDTVQRSYDLEYGTNTIEMHHDSISKGDKVVITDDLIATGGTLAATVELIEQLGGEVVAIIALIELTDLKGRDLLGDHVVKSLIQYPC